MNNMRNKILMTLALLITAVGGAWAEDIQVKEITSDLTGTWQNDNVNIKATELPGFVPVSLDEAKAMAGSLPTSGYVYLFYAFDGGKTCYAVFQNGNYQRNGAANQTHSQVIMTVASAAKVYYTYDPNAIDVKPVAGKTNEWTFTMPAFDVELTPLYAPEADWAIVETVKQLPTAIEGIFAGTTDAIVKAGTVAKIGNTENVQGQVMYFATTDAEMTAEKAAKADGWLATVPTAEGYDGAQTVYVWYYIKGADTPDGQEATAENTFNDSEICETPIKVTVLSNKYDINFKAANDNTIQAGKATVKVGETAAQVDEKGNLTSVKMNSKVTVTAKEGYKFRKAEGKKHEVKD